MVAVNLNRLSAKQFERRLVAEFGPRFHQPATIELDPAQYRATYFRNGNPLLWRDGDAGPDGPLRCAERRIETADADAHSIAVAAVEVQNDDTIFGLATVTELMLTSFTEINRSIGNPATDGAESSEVGALKEFTNRLCGSLWFVVAAIDLDWTIVVNEDDAVIVSRLRPAADPCVNPRAVADAVELIRDSRVGAAPLTERTLMRLVDEEPSVDLISKHLDTAVRDRSTMLCLRIARRMMDPSQYESALARLRGEIGD